ncbi:hypothetical protein [Streptomyces griseosporeus]|uniref:hypothetical protein n=1 Tax=Streptomyces griseosporeus TaxID=1910 RepID=UPI0037BCFDF0
MCTRTWWPPGCCSPSPCADSIRCAAAGALTVSGGTLLAAGALHAVLARTLYASPPPGTTFAADDLHNAARLMYYGGDLAELGLAVVIGVGWYAARARRDRHVTASRPAALPTGSGGRVA